MLLTAGPGEYNHENADKLTKIRNPAWEWQNNQGRTEAILDPSGGPGTYEDHHRFGDDSKAQEFGVRREEKIQMGPGPGEYTHERADGAVRQRNPAWDFRGTSGRISPVIDPCGGPGSYENHHKFGDDSKTQEFGIKREEKIANGPGPSQYRHEDADGIVMQRNPAWKFEKNTGRKDAIMDPNRGPGSYKYNYKFGDDSKAQEFGVRHEEKIPIGPGPGEYRHEEADSIVNQRHPAWDFKNSTGRKDVVADPNGGSGSYDDHYKFGDDSKAQEFGVRRENIIQITPGPGQYRHEDADGTVKQRNPAWEWHHNTGRQEFVDDPNRGPGSYNDHHKFGDDSKAQEFGIRREEKIPIGPGPGEYRHEEADGLVKQRHPAWDFKNSTGRKDVVADPNGGPGSYDDHHRFGDDSKAQEFGVKRENIIPVTPGPGQYRHEDADGVVRQRNAAWDWVHNTGRRDLIADPEGGPGTYNDHHKFGDDSKAQEFGVRRENNIPVTPGPGQYRHEDADGIVKQRNPAWDWHHNTGRKEKIGDPNVGPGSYDDGQRFGNDSKAQEFGVKREEKIPIGPGPGEYQHENADRVTKFRNPQWDWKNNTGRKDVVSDPQGGPGTYDGHQNFGNDSRAQEFGVRREEKIPNGPGPGQYRHEEADIIVKQRNPAWDFSNNTGRKEVVADPEGGPGSYDDGYNFGGDSKAQQFGIRREEKIPIGPGPGEYRHEEADRTIKQRNPAWNFNNVTGRKDVEVDPNCGPGTYDDGIKFGDGSKAQEFGVRREEKIPIVPGPGQYRFEDADGSIKQRSPAWDWKNTSGRKEASVDPSGGPGSQQENRNFGSDCKNMTIGARRDSKIPVCPGPGDYSPDRSENLTKNSSKQTDFSRRSPRKSLVADPNGGPGSYEYRSTFDEQLNGMTIGVRREQVLKQSVGPGEYSPEKSTSITKPRARAANFKSQTQRQSLQESPDLGPGTYNNTVNFGDELNRVTIGQRRHQQQAQTPGPADYSPSHSITKSKSAAYLFYNKQGRTESPADPSGGPAQYTTSFKDFGRELGPMTIGSKYDERILQTPGPGEYHPERADSLTKLTNRSTNFQNSPKRPETKIEANGGPGTYDAHTNFGQKLGPQTIGVKRQPKTPKGLGPGHYSPEKATSIIKPNQPMISFSNKKGRTSQKIDPNGGPGTYQSLDKFSSPKKMTIGQRRESQPDTKTPGPGYYKPTANLTQRTTPASSFKSGRKTQLLSPSNGPGSYLGHTSSFTTQAYTMGAKRNLKQDTNPAPGQYNVNSSNVRPRSPEANFKKSVGRKESKIDPSGGPGTYSTYLQSPDKPMTIGVKRADHFERTPGPGDYQPERADSQTKVGTVSVDFTKSSMKTIGHQVNEALPFEVSIGGPGQYEPQRADHISKKSARKVNFARATSRSMSQSKSTSAIVGPGSYNIERADLQTKFRIPSAKIPNSQTASSKTIESRVGPGAYNEQDMSRGPMYTISERRQSKIESSPGPGHYQPAKNSSFISSADRKTANTSRSKANNSLLTSEQDFYKYLMKPQYGLLSVSPNKSTQKSAKKTSAIKPYSALLKKSAQKSAVQQDLKPVRGQDKKPQYSPVKEHYSGMYTVGKSSPTKQK